MTDRASRVSVVIPVFNGAAFLAGAIENVLAQEYQPLEIVIVDDGSTDGTADVARSWSAVSRYLYQPNAGPSAARNHGIRSASGPLIAFLDVDDLWSRHTLATQAAYLRDHSDIEIVQGLIQQVRANDPGAAQAARLEPISQPYNYVNLGSALYRKSVFERVGLFDETLRDNEDTDWFIRAWEHGVSKAVLDRVVLLYRQHAANMSHDQVTVNYGLTKLVKKHLDRSRRWPRPWAHGGARRPGVVAYLGRPPTERSESGEAAE